jgi:hypothetical protein
MIESVITKDKSSKIDALRNPYAPVYLLLGNARIVCNNFLEKKFRNFCHQKKRVFFSLPLFFLPQKSCGTFFARNLYDAKIMPRTLGLCPQ